MFGPSGPPGGGIVLLVLAVILSFVTSIIAVFIKRGRTYSKLKTFFSAFGLTYGWFLVAYAAAVFVFNLLSDVGFQRFKHKMELSYYFLVGSYVSYYYLLYFMDNRCRKPHLQQ